MPTVCGAGLAFAQPKVSKTLVGANAAVGVNAMTKLCPASAAMLTGVSVVPVSALVVGLVVRKWKLAGMLVAGAIAQVEALPCPALRIVANAVAVAPTATERLSGNTAATSPM
jgi:hypothetical protein